MAAPARDFSSWLQDGRRSDVTLRIVLEAEPQRQAAPDTAASPDAAPKRATRSSAAARKRRVLEEFAAHSVILEDASGWAAVMLCSPESRESQQGSLDIVVGDEAEGAAASLLVRAMYAGSPSTLLEGQPQLALLQVLRLADRLQAPRCIEAAGATLAAVESLEWETAAAIWALPGGCADNLAYAAAFDAAAAAVQQQLGDLDAALADGSKREQLLALPFGALRRLLESDETRASSENVAFWVAGAWLQQHGGGSEEQQQHKQLAAALRLHHMSPLFLTALARSWLPAKDWQRAAAFVAVTKKVQTVVKDEEGYSALRRPRRPASAVNKGVLRWDVPLAQLKELHEEAAGKRVGGRACVESGSLAWWGGFSWKLRLDADRLNHGVEFGMYIVPVPHSSFACGALVTATTTLRVLDAGVSKSADPDVFSDVDGSMGSGWFDFFSLGPQAAWDEAAWRGAGLVSEGDVVRIEATIGMMH